MKESERIDRLALFGMTRHEATIYLCLYRNGSMTGYEAAKLTGISRSNVYSALAGLADQGAIRRIEGSSSKYVAVAVEEFCEDKIRQLQQSADWLKENLTPSTKPEVGYVTIAGDRQILDKARHMIEQAEKRVYLSASYDLIDSLSSALSAALNRKIKVILMSERFPETLKGAVLYRLQNREAQIRLICDSRIVLTGEWTGSPDDQCLFSGQRVLVETLKDSMRNEIKLIELSGRKKKS